MFIVLMRGSKLSLAELGKMVDGGCQPGQRTEKSSGSPLFLQKWAVWQLFAQPRACLTTTLTLEMIAPMCPSPHVRDLIHQNDDLQPLQRLQGLIEEGLASGPAEARSADELDELRAIARGEQH